MTDPMSPSPGTRSGSRPGWRRRVSDILIGAAAPLVIGLPFMLDPDGAARFRPGAVLMGVLVAVAAWRGLRAGITAAIVSTTIVWHSFTNPRTSFGVGDWTELSALLAYALTAALVLVLVARLGHARRREHFQRALLDTLVDQAPVGLAYFDGDLRPQLVNRYLERRDGPALDEQPLMRRALESGEAVTDREISVDAGDGRSARHWRVSYYPVREGDAVSGIGAVVADVTDDVLMRRRRMEVLQLAQALAGLTTREDAADAAAQFLARTFECRAAVAFVADGELEVFARAAVDAAPAIWAGRRVPLSTPAPITDAVRSGSVVTVASAAEMRARYPTVVTGVEGRYEASAASFPLRAHDVEGAPVIGVIHLSWPYDRALTEHSRVTMLTVAAILGGAATLLQRAEQATEQRFRAALEAMVNTVAITRAVRDESGRIVDFVIEYITGPGTDTPRRTPSELVGRRVAELYPSWHKGELLDRLIAVVETGVPIVETRAPFSDVLSDGTELHGFLDFQAVKFDDGYLISAQNVTEAVLGEVRARELEREREQREIVDRFATLTTALGGAVTIDDVADAACRYGAAAIGADLGVIATRDRGDRVVLTMPEHLPEQFAGGRTRLVLDGPSPFRDAMARGEWIVLESLHELDAAPGSFLRRMADAGLHSVAFVPLSTEEGDIIGALAFGWWKPPPFSLREDRRITTVAGVVGTALQRASAGEAEQARRRQADRLARLAADLAAAVDTDAVWRICAEHLMPLFDATTAAVGRMDERSDSLLLTYTDALDATEPWPSLPISLHVAAPLSEAASERRVVVTNSRAELEARYPDLTYRKDGAWEANAAVPVVGTAGVLGVLGVALPPGRSFDAADHRLLEVLGSVVGQAAARAELFERERIRRQMSEAFTRVASEVVAAQADDPAVLIARGVAEVLGTKWYGVYMREGAALRLLDDETGRHPTREVVSLDEPLPVVDAAHRGEPIVLADATEWALHYPEVRNFPAVPSLTLPLHDEQGRVAAVIGLGYPDETRIPRHVLDNLEQITRQWSDVYQRALAAVERARVAEREHDIAVALQHAMLGRPDPVLRAEWGAAYRPADGTLEVGGDWYDLIELDDHRVAVVVGDVVGHHLAAAAAMGQLRSAVRALAPTVDDPADLLSRLDDIVEHIDGAMSATILYGVLDCVAGEFRYSGAGHLPPLLVTTDGDTTYLEEGRNVPLGGFLRRTRKTASARVSEQDWLILYSDGLVERRGESLDDGLGRLVHAARLGCVLDGPALCSHLLTALVTNTTQDDDIAVLAIRPIPAEIRLRRPAEPQILRGARETLRAWLRTVDASTEEIDELVLSAGEVLANAIEHARPVGAPATVELGASERAGVVHIEVRDRGRWHTRTAPADETRGFGLQIVRRFTDDVVIRQGDDGTRVEMSRRLASARAPS